MVIEHLMHKQTSTKIKVDEARQHLIDALNLECASEHWDQAIELEIGSKSNDLACTLAVPYGGLEGAMQSSLESLGYRVAPAFVSPQHLQGETHLGLAQVRNVIAIASGKGGVGKSSTAVAIALSLANQGARTGLLDADIYGPSLPRMLGLRDRPSVNEHQQLVPIQATGIPCMSMGLLNPERQPAIWRGPMASGAMRQMLERTAWGELDYLLVDLPPGTGDIQLTLAQSIPLSGAIAVTTPQEVALEDVRKAVQMFSKLQVPLLGVVENMSGYVCSHCGQIDYPFGEGGGATLAREQQLDFLGAVPLDSAFRADLDKGKLNLDSPGTAATAYAGIARHVALGLAGLERQEPVPVTASE